MKRVYIYSDATGVTDTDLGVADGIGVTHLKMKEVARDGDRVLYVTTEPYNQSFDSCLFGVTELTCELLEESPWMKTPKSEDYKPSPGCCKALFSDYVEDHPIGYVRSKVYVTSGTEVHFSIEEEV